jgi:hypothetical protein
VTAGSKTEAKAGNKAEMTTGTKIIIAGVCGSVFVIALVIVKITYPGLLWHVLFETQGGAVGIGVMTGVVSSLVATIVYSLRHKEVWEKDIAGLKQDAEDIKSYLENEVTQLRRDHDLLLNQIPAAIGGPFTNSLFAFPPMASKEIARILSDQAKDQYGRHHKRVVVKRAHDHYEIKGLKVINFAPVWELEFRITWSWLNDSRITKSPLDDFLLVADAELEALESVLPDDMASKEKDDKYKERLKFLEGNIVRSIIVNPSNPGTIWRGELDDVFEVKRVYVNTKTIPASQLQRIPKVPIGVYAAWSLPKSDPECNPPLPIDSELTIEYVGRMCLAASHPDSKTYGGLMTFPPSDVISEAYELTLTYPLSIKFGAEMLSLGVVRNSSGCRFVHGPLDYTPSVDDDPKGGCIAKMRVRGPLTDLNQLSLTWKGEVS